LGEFISARGGRTVGGGKKPLVRGEGGEVRKSEKKATPPMRGVGNLTFRSKWERYGSGQRLYDVEKNCHEEKGNQ